MFTDMVGYSTLTQKNEALALELLDEHRGLLREAFARHGGREIEAVGDGFFVECPSALAAARCAVEIQRILHERNASQPSDRRFQVRIGLHLGDVVVQSERVHGDGVNIAARIEPLAEPGGICLSEDVARQIQNKIELPLRKLGKPDLKNIQVPVQIYRLVLPWERKHLPGSERLAFSMRQREVRRALIGAGGLLVVGGLAGTWIWRRAQTPAQPINNRIAVLPLASMSASPNDEYFVDGMTEELISRLSRVKGLEVIARTSIASYKGSKKKIGEIARELDVGTVLEGSVRKAGDKVRITAQLINATTEAHLWSEDYDRELKDIFAVQTDIAQRVADALALKLAPAQAEPRVGTITENLEAYNAYLQGRFYANKATPEGVLKGIEQFQIAVRLDPSFALAYAALSDAYAQVPSQTGASGHEVYPAARAAALRALEIDESLPEAHTALGVVKTFYDWDWPGAGREFTRALELNRTSAIAHYWYGWYLLFLRDFDSGIGEMRKALQLDPVSIAMNIDLGWALQFVARWDEAILHLKKTLELDPRNPLALACLGWAYLGRGVWTGQGMWKEAEAAIEQEVQLYGREPWALADLAGSYALAGDERHALLIIEEVKEAVAKTKREDPWVFVISYASLAIRNDKYRDAMFVWLDKAVTARSFWLAQTSNHWWDRFHSDPRWIGFRKKLGLPP